MSAVRRPQPAQAAKTGSVPAEIRSGDRLVSRLRRLRDEHHRRRGRQTRSGWVRERFRANPDQRRGVIHRPKSLLPQSLTEVDPDRRLSEALPPRLRSHPRTYPPATVLSDSSRPTGTRKASLSPVTNARPKTFTNPPRGPDRAIPVRAFESGQFYPS